MTIDEYQRAAGRTVNPALDGRDRLLDAAAGLAEEAGEVLGHVRKHLYMGHDLDRERLVGELGDALWCIAMVADAVGVPLGEVASSNLAKLRARYPAGYSDDDSRSARDPRPAPDA